MKHFLIHPHCFYNPLTPIKSIKKYIFTLFISIFSCTYLYSQINISSDKALTDTILHSPQPYKLIYILCDYCQPSVERFPKVIEQVKCHKDIALFPICAQDSQEVVTYLEKYRLGTPVYLINQNRKRKLIDFYNPIKAVCKFLDRQLNIPTEKMGASDYCLLDKDNQVILRTNWEMQDDLYYGQLEEFLKQTINKK